MIFTLIATFLMFSAHAQVQIYDNYSSYTKSEVSGLKNGDLLYGIRHIGTGYDIKKIPISLEETVDVQDEVTVALKGDPQALFFIKGMDLKEGKLAAENLDNFKLPGLGKEKKLAKELSASVRVDGKVIGKYDNIAIDIDLVKDYKITFNVKGKTASIIDTDSGMPSFGVIFLGDLNRDGYVDAYLNMDRNEKDGNHKLFLSEIKNGKYLLKEIP